jgi:hypothetical protein
MLTYCGTMSLLDKPEPICAPVYPYLARGFPRPQRDHSKVVQMYHRGETSHHPELSRTTSWSGGAGPVRRLAEELALTLGCPVEVSYRGETREVIAVARPETGGEIRVSLTVSPMGLWLMDNPFVALKYDLLRQLRRQMGLPHHEDPI